MKEAQPAPEQPAAFAPAAFLDSPRTIAHPGASHSLATRAFQGIPSLALSPAGRLWATWYAGVTPDEDHNNYVVLATSADGGAAWEELLVVDPDGPGPVRAFDPELWVDPDNRLWWFWAQSIAHEGTVAGVWAMTAEQADSAAPAWSSPRRLTDGIMMCKPVVLSSGEWILPVSTWKKTDHSAKVVVSTDHGRTWSVRSGCQVPEPDRNYDEHMIVERRDGSLWMLVRTRYGIGESVSTDRGLTWSPLMPSAVQHPSSRFFIRRLQSGNLLLVKHGPIGERTDRSRLTAYLSADDGRVWRGGLMLDERQGVSYPDGQQGEDGAIYIIYDYSRTGAREIQMARFTESDVLEGRAVSGAAALRRVVSRYPGAG
jgi:predicted neuraminidase